MSDMEFSRRIATGTLQCSNVAAQTITKLSSDPAKAIKRAKVRTFNDALSFPIS